MLPITHVLALDALRARRPQRRGLHDIWGMSNTTAMAALSLGVVVLFAVALTAAAIRAFQHTAVR